MEALFRVPHGRASQELNAQIQCCPLRLADLIFPGRPSPFCNIELSLRRLNSLADFPPTTFFALLAGRSRIRKVSQCDLSPATSPPFCIATVYMFLSLFLFPITELTSPFSAPNSHPV